VVRRARLFQRRAMPPPPDDRGCHASAAVAVRVCVWMLCGSSCDDVVTRPCTVTPTWQHLLSVVRLRDCDGLGDGGLCVAVWSVVTGAAAYFPMCRCCRAVCVFADHERGIWAVDCATMHDCCTWLLHHSHSHTRALQVVQRRQQFLFSRTLVGRLGRCFFVRQLVFGQRSEFLWSLMPSFGMRRVCSRWPGRGVAVGRWVQFFSQAD
jgi:hypothetical protein